MTDRVPGAPGQYRATVSSEEFSKLQNGEAFTITMLRDDVPLTEGTPYSKAAVLPDSVANVICPDIQDPSPADAFAGLLPLRGGTMTGPLSLAVQLDVASGGTGAKTAADALTNLGAAPMAYAKKVGNPHNLLDNSDFTNPVNQAGNVYVTAKGSYPIDRWQYSYDGDTPRGGAGYDGTRKYVYLINDSDGGNTMLYQKISADKLKDGKYTIAFHQAGTNVTLSVLAYANGGTVKSVSSVSPINGTILMSFELTQIQTELTIYIYAGPGKTICMDWAALYEGEYTVDTLPEYQPKGYAVESLACGVITKDYVVAQGTSGDWHYRKWNSGRAECWYCEWFVPTASGLNPATLAHAYMQSFTLPFSFTDIMYSVNATVQHGSGYGIITRTVVGSASTFSVFWDANSAMSTADARISVQVNGYWK